MIEDTTNAFFHFFRFSAPADHHLDDLLIRLGHAHTSQPADVFDGVFYALDDDAVTAVELRPLHLHLHAQQAGLDRGGNLGSTAGLGAVADHAGVDGYGIDNGMRNLARLAAIEIGDAGARAAARAGGPAISGKTADAGLQMDRDQVGNHQCAIELFCRRAEMLGVNNDGWRAGRGRPPPR